MDRSSYLAHRDVSQFLQWAAPLVAGERPLQQKWKSPRWGAQAYETIFDAYRNFAWRFSLTLPGDSAPTVGHSFEENERALKRMAGLLCRSAESGDPTQFHEAVLTMLRWGGVGIRRNAERLERLGENRLPAILGGAEQLRPLEANLLKLDRVVVMNSGFSKLYSLLIEGFPIYDSRVACSLASLVRNYCLEAGLATVPEQLAFGIPPSNVRVSRNPSVGELRFPVLRWGDAQNYAKANLRAAWVLGALSGEGYFSTLPEPSRLLALQSAMFMIGYAVLPLSATIPSVD